jgi:hypothetical protein
MAVGNRAARERVRVGVQSAGSWRTLKECCEGAGRAVVNAAQRSTACLFTTLRN